MALDQKEIAIILEQIATKKPFERIPVNADWLVSITEDFCAEYGYQHPTDARATLVDIPAAILYQFMQAAHDHGKH